MPTKNAWLTPPLSWFVPMNTWKATSLGTEADATEIASTKLPNMPMFCTVLRTPEMLPNEPVRALAITALLLAGKNMDVPKPEMAEAMRTM